MRHSNSQTFMPPGPAAQAAFNVGRIGPNAIVQVFAALEEVAGQSTLITVAEKAQLKMCLDHPPTQMVDERHVVRLHQTVRQHLQPSQAEAVLTLGGQLTARYILANRIPKAAQMVLKALPAQLASPLLLKAIARHAWTFAGSGTFTHHGSTPALITLSGCPACDDVYRDTEPCAYYLATFQGLFQALVHRKSTCRQVFAYAANNTADGAPARQFIIDWH